jgi:isopentenyl diphosphate isomerase/L-lactate dehydrogenase-like FMN-dependent dehydrogenase
MRYDDLLETGLRRIRKVGMDAYLDLGAETGSQNRINRDYADSLVFEMRILGSREATLETELFGCKLASPIIASTFCESRVLKRLDGWEVPYLQQIAGGLADSGSLMSVGHVTLDELAAIVDEGAPVMHIVKPYQDEARVIRHLEYAKEVGCVAVGMDVDAMFLEKAWDEVPGPEELGPQTIEQLERYCRVSDLPFVVKGVLSAQDAIRAREIGASAVMVSNHGGEAIDYSVPVLEALPRIRAAVPDLTVLVDSGFRRGTDVLKAITLGADAVGLVTLLLIAAAANGRDGVRAMVEILNEELQRTMSYVGFPTVADTDPSALKSLARCEPITSSQLADLELKAAS